MKLSFFTLILSLFLIGSAWAICPSGDLNGDCYVDMLDIQIFAEQWLEPSDPSSEPNYADFDGINGVNMSDFVLLTENWHLSGNPLVINEFMASNSKSFADTQGEYDDWIEIYNSGNYAVDLEGMYLTDNLTNPTKWRVQSNTRGATTIGAGGYLIIWADGDTSSDGLHANFKLSAGGEEIALFGSDGDTLIDSVSFPEQAGDISFGRYPDADEKLRFLSSPTPAAVNSGVYLGDVATPKFSHKRGFYTSPFSVTIATETKDAVIYYTLDGSEPFNFDTSGRSRSPGGMIYSVPISINKTTCLRAKAIKPGYRPSDIKTHTYMMNASDAHRSLTVISLVGDDRTTFYEPDGVMAIVGGSYVNNGQWSASGQNSHNNPMHRGMAYERPVSFEWIKPESRGRIPQSGSDLQINCGLRVHGSNYMRPRYTRSNGVWSGNSKFSLRLYFRSRYGESRLNYPLFPFEVQEFKSIVLRGGHNDRTNPFIKDELQRRLHKDMGNVASVGTMANLFINGQYKGFFNPCEHIKDEFCRQWYKSDKDWDIMTMNGVRDGDAVSFNELTNYARNNNLANDTHYQFVSERLDIPAFADYLILQLWSGNWDWPQNNWSAASERSEEGKWRFFIWDIEGGMYSDRLNTVFFDSLNSQGNANGYLYRALKVNNNFKQIFADRINKHFYNNGALSAENINNRFLELQDQMSGVIPNMNTYVIDTWVPNRLDIFLAACIKEGLFTVAGPTFEINNFYQHGGHISPSDSLTITSPGRFSTLYYTLDGSDPRFQGLPQQDTNTATLLYENEDKRVLVSSRPIGNVWKDPGVFNDSRWLESAGGPGGVGYDRNSTYSHLITLDLEEQMYEKNAACYIRIPFTLDARQSGYDSMVLRIRYDDGFIAYLNGIEVARRNILGTPTASSGANQDRPNTEAFNFEYIDISAFLSELQTGNNLLAIQGLNFSNSSSEFLISAELAAGKSSTSPDQNNDSDITNGVLLYDGPITLNHTTQVKARILNGRSWSALTQATFAIGPLTNNLRITEIMYNPFIPDTEYVELKNIGAETINLNLVKFTNGIDLTFPNIELTPNEYIVVVQDYQAFETRYGQRINIAGQYSGSLNNAGERIKLQDAVGQTILDFEYKDGWRSITDGDGFSLNVIDPVNTEPYGWNEKDSWRSSAYLSGSPGEDDSGIIPAPGAVVINEVLAHSHADAADWIELHNTTSTFIDIGGWFISDSDSDLTKYQIAAGTRIAPNGYIVFYEDLHFNNPSDPGSNQPFALSENGERLFLSSAEGALLTGYRQVEDFGGSETGVSFGRYYKPSTGNYNFVPMSENTPGLANAYPKVGPIVINEIMYNPSWPVGGTYTNDQYEYVELHNISSEPVTLYNFDKALPWKFTDGIDFTFPADVPVTISAGGYLLVVKDPEAFSWRYPSVPADKILGPYSGSLNNAGERLELSMPGDMDESGELYYIRVDRVTYSDGSHPENSPDGIDHWPTTPDDGWVSLSRISPQNYGNDPDNWTASSPSPGTINP
ncbi:MAG: hypothetical protein GY774_03315 [Planctomycetes bacterium]|nr:hypothetical protein [Planctomycetota bacterium]